MEEILPQSPQEEPSLLTLGAQISSLQSCETVKVYCLGHCLGYIVITVLGT